jgi:predicted nucleotidyltransferase
MSEGVESAFVRQARLSTSWDEFVNNLTSKRYPRGRVQRQLIHTLLGLDHWTNRGLQRTGPPYLRVLGANSRGRALIRQMKEKATLPLVSRGADIPPGPATSMERFRKMAGIVWEGLLTAEAQESPFPPPLMT